MAPWRRAIAAAVSAEPFQFDPEYMTAILPHMRRWTEYFHASVVGIDHVPAQGPVLLVGNHSGGLLTPDTAALYVQWYARFGVSRPLMGVGFDAAFTVPALGRVMRRIGQLPGSQNNAREALKRGVGLLVYPGGSKEVFRPFTERHQIQLGGRKGFLRLAMATGVPIVPVVSHGGHETTVVLARGAGLARALGLKERLRVDVMPLLLQFPWGLSPPALPGVPLPAKIHVEALEPLRFGPNADLETAYATVVGRMQTCMDRLVVAHPSPLREGMERHWRRLWG